MRRSAGWALLIAIGAFVYVATADTFDPTPIPKPTPGVEVQP